MNCGLCFSPLRRTKVFNIFEELFDDTSRLVDIIERYLRMKIKSTESQSFVICQSCYTHLYDFHKFALFINDKQELLKHDIPTIKLDDSEEEQDASYIKDTDVLVEFKTESGDTLMANNEELIPQEDLLMVSESMNDFHYNSRFNVDHSMSISSFEQMSWLGGHETSKSKTSAKIPRKTPYKTHTPEDRARIVEAANRGDDWSALASELGVKYKTAYTWVSTSRKEMFMNNGKNNTRFKDKEIDTIIQWIENNHQLTLKEIVAKVKITMRKDVCVYFIEGILEGRLYRHKRSLDYHPQFINTLENRKKRLEFVNTLKYYVNLKKTVIWLGETSFKMFCRRAKGRFNTNTTFATFDHPMIYVMGAISEDGVIGIRRGRDRIRPEAIFKKNTKPKNLTNLVIVCDSDYCFSELDEYFNNSEVTLLLLSPYSYMINPMETIWSNILSNVKCNISMLNNNTNDVKEQRLVIAEKCIDQIIARISAEDCDVAIKNSNKYHDDVINLQDMPVKLF